MTLPEFDIALIAVLATIALAGLVRGFSGFGTGMIVIPVLAATRDPVTAVVVVAIIDSLPQMPAALPALRYTRWREVLPLALAALLTLPAGLAVLRTGDPLALRWAICAAVLLAVALLASGWRYHGPRPPLLSGTIGALAGFLGGIGGIPGPPPVLYWMASPEPPAVIRANLFALLLILDLATLANVLGTGMMTADRLALGLVAAPVYLTGILAGRALFPLASAAAYRRLAFVVILVAVVTALPVWDG
ncbi:TSUP family transporter [Zhengella mangrovi]|uniref:TSUP family transporter n=1 Tax=Zhengella mangrovi TaxID=1982044 RepID=UPI001FE1CA9E|nr:TSUP family transporter [Zhengella mangrovi]